MTDQRSRAQYTGSPATLADHEREDFRLKPTCRKCWHAGEAMTPAEVAKRFGVPMTKETYLAEVLDNNTVARQAPHSAHWGKFPLTAPAP